MSQKVFINILNWNKPIDTIECLESCKKIRYDNYEVVLIDNHSSDNSVKLFEERFPEITLLKNSRNLGYAGGNNVGIRYALERGTEYVLILNNDIVVEPNILDELVSAMNRSLRAGMAAPKVLYYHDRTLINSLGTSVDWLRLRPRLGECQQRDNGRFSEIVERDVLVGCALFVRRETIERIGLIDEKFFIFHEDADWCYRNLKSGFRNIVVPQAVVYHKGSGTMREFSELTHYYSIRNFLYMAHKNASLRDLTIVYVGLACLILRHGFYALFSDRKERKISRAFFLGIYDFFKNQMGKCRRAF